MKFAYLLLVHKNPLQLKRLIMALDNENSIFVIHVDLTVSVWPFIKQLNIPLKGRILFTPKRINVRWGRFSVVEATMNLIDFFFKLHIKTDYIHLLSGQDYPVKSINEIFSFFIDNYGKSFIEHFKLPIMEWDGFYRIEGRWGVNEYEDMSYSDLDYYKENVKITILPKMIQPYGGSQWWSLHYDCLSFIYEQYRTKCNLFDFYQFCLIPDEMIFQTLLMNSKFKTTIVNNNLRYIKWKGKKAHPESLTEHNIKDFYFEENLYARKFNSYKETVLDKIDRIIKSCDNYNVSRGEEKKYCLISTVGKHSVHHQWISKEHQSFDIHLIVYDDSYQSYKNDSKYVTEAKGYKLKAVYDYLVKNSEIIQYYDYFFIPDEDLLMDCISINRLFVSMEEFCLDIAQPVLYKSFNGSNHTQAFYDSIIRYTNFVDKRLPCFSKKALKKVLFTFNEKETCIGVDYHWGKVINCEKHNMAIIGGVKAFHNKPNILQNKKYIEELNKYLNKYNLDMDIIQYK